jgi:hypothetical protein
MAELCGCGHPRPIHAYGLGYCFWCHWQMFEMDGSLWLYNPQRCWRFREGD